MSNRKLGPLPVYFGLQSEASHPLYILHDRGVELDQSIGRLDFAPSVRMPINRLTFINVNLNVLNRTTWYSESLNQTGAAGARGLHPQLHRAPRRHHRPGVQQGLHPQQLRSPTG